MPSGASGQAYKEIRSEDRSSSRLPFITLFVPASYWLDNEKTTEGVKNGIQWTLWSQLEDLDFADDIALLAHNLQQIQDKTTKLRTISSKVGLDIHPGKKQVIRMNTLSLSTAPVSLDGSNLEEVQSFTYLGSKIDRLGGTDADVKARIGKARTVFIWNSQ